MRKVIVAVALLVIFLVPAVATFAADEPGNGGDRELSVTQDVNQIDSTTPGTVAGSDKLYFGPYYEQHLDNMGH
jgi:hypothetical protein